MLKALLDAIHGSDNQIAGTYFTKLTAQLLSTETTHMNVESTLDFQKFNSSDWRVLVDGEIIEAKIRSLSPMRFSTLTRGVNSTIVKSHPVGTFVLDIGRAVSALDDVRRGILLDYAEGEDLDIIARNLGVPKCPGLVDAMWRELIKIMAYLAKTPLDSFRRVLDQYKPGEYTLQEKLISDRWKVFVYISVALESTLRGRFVLNGGEQRVTTGLNTVTTVYPINHVIGVYADTVLARRGLRDGLTNFLNPGGSFVGSTITLGTSPGGIGTAVIVDYGASKAHYPPLDETIVDNNDRYPYLADPLLTAQCLLDHIRAAGIKVEVGALL